MVTLRPGQRILNIPGIGVQTSRRAVSGGNGLLNGLVAYWSLNEAAGANNALDMHSNGLTLTQQSSPGADTGKVYATARTFDGSADYFNRTSQALLQTGDVDFTIAAWIYPTAIRTVKQGIVGKWDDGEAFEYNLSLTATNNYMSFNVYKSGLSSAIGPSPSVNQWYLMVGWYDAVNDLTCLSINDGATISSSWASGASAANVAFRIGRNYFQHPFSGRIGPVAMWKSAAGGGGVLSSSQRSALWNGGAGLPYASFTI